MPHRKVIVSVVQRIVKIYVGIMSPLLFGAFSTASQLARKDLTSHSQNRLTYLSCKYI